MAHDHFSTKMIVDTFPRTVYDSTSLAMATVGVRGEGMKIAKMLVICMGTLGLAFGMGGCAANGQLTYANGAAPAAQPAQAPKKDYVNAGTKEDLEATMAAVNKQMQPGGIFQYTNPSDRNVVKSHLDDMLNLLTQHGPFKEMNASAQDRMMQDQNTINELLARNDSNRLVCDTETPTGTHFPQKVCRTYGQIQMQRAAAGNMLRNSNNEGHPFNSGGP